MSANIITNRLVENLKTWLVKNYGYLLTGLGCFLFLNHFYGDILFHPNDYMMSSSGDGMKNYYTLAYHLKHDSSITHFGGMHYPYGDHVNYTDGHPFVGLILWFIPGSAGYSVGIINLLMLLSILVSGLVTFRIFRLFNLHQVLASIAACSIAFLSPQIWRFGGHYSLAHAYVVPLAIFWLIKSIQSGQLKYAIYMGVLAFVFFYIHPYLSMMVIFLSGLTFMFHIIHRQRIKEWRAYLPILISTLAPVFVFTVFNLFAESHSNRPEVPNGFFQHHATVETVFVPNHPPLQHFMSQIIKVKQQPWEGWSYIGFMAILCMVSFVIFTLVKAIQKKTPRKLLLPFPQPFGYLVLAGTLLLLFSMCLPFRWGLESWSEHIGPLRQFRALGRFSWPFFYIITIWSFVILSVHIRHKALLAGLILIGASLNFIEGREPHKGVQNLVTGHPNKFLAKNLTPDEKRAIDLIEQQDCVAMISLPFFHVGSEYYTQVGSGASLYNTMIYSYFTGLPSFNSWLGRSSIDETMNINGLFTPDFIEKPIVNDLNLDDYVLIIWHPGTILSDLGVLKGAIEIDEIAGVKFFKNRLANIFEDTHEDILTNPLYSEISKSQTHLERAVDNAPYFVEDFEKNGTTNVAYQGNKAYEGMKKDFHPFPIDSAIINAHERIKVSFWFNCEEPLSTIGVMCYILETGDDGYKQLIDPKGMTAIRFLDDNWGLVTLDLEVGSKEHDYSFCIAGQEGNESLFQIDNLMFHGWDGIYTGQEGRVFFNNYPIEP